MENSFPSSVRRMLWSGVALSCGVAVVVYAAWQPLSADSYNRAGNFQQPDRETGNDGYPAETQPGLRTRTLTASEPDRRSRYGTPNFRSSAYGSNANRQTSLQHSGDDRDSNTGTQSRRSDNEPSVRFLFTNATWSTVLKKVAESTDSTLVMREIPPGRYSKYMPRKVSRKDAVEILNQELEPKGFRIVEKGKFLDVLYLRSARAEYHRPEMPQHREWNGGNRISQDVTAQRQFPKYERRVTPIAQRVQRDSQPASAAALADRLRNVKKINKSTPWSKPAAEVKEVEEPPVTQTVRTKNRRAVDIARAIYRPLKSRSNLIDAGPSGLPAFAVKLPPSPTARRPLSPTDGKVLFTIGIDSARNELVVKAPPTRNRDVVSLIEYLDGVELANHETLQVVPTAADPTAIAKTLRPQLALLAQGQPAAQPKQPMGKEPPAGVGGDIIPIIQGRVTIRDVPGVGLVVTGNKADVEAVLKIIRELDRQGLVTAPNVAVHQLQHVNSQALAELLSAVYAQLATVRSGATNNPATVAFLPVVRPNALLIISSRADLPSVLKLIGELDRPVDPEKEYRVFHLKYAVSSQVVANLDALFQQQAATGTGAAATRGLGSRVRAIADVRSNAVIIEAAPNDMKTVSELISKLDAENIGSVSRVKVIRLKNAVATELATLVNNAIQSVINTPTLTGQGQIGGAGAGQSAQQLRDARSSILEFMVPEGDRKRLVRSGILSDIRVTADPRINALVVTAPDQSMQLLEQLILQLDQPSALVAEIKVFTLANGDATSMITLLQSLFPTQQTGGQAGQQGQLGIQIANADDASSGLIPLRFSVDPRTNSIIAIGGAEALRVVEAVIFRLDESDIRQRQTTVIRLRNAPVTEVSTAINNFLTSQRNLAQIDPNIITNMELLEREIIVVPETISNSLLVSATPRFFEEIQAIIARLDQPPPQVVIQALLVEVELNNTDEFGIELGFQDSILFDRSVISNQVFGPTVTNTAPNGVQTTTQSVVSQESAPGFNFAANPLGNNTAINPSQIGTQGFNNFSLGRVNGDLGFGGLVLSAQSSSISALLRALSAKRTVHVLSRPQITTLDNQLAQIQVGQTVPRVNGVNVTTTGAANPIVADTPVGIILTVTPRVRADGTIIMETVAEKSNLAGQGVPIYVDATTGNVVESPIINITTARTSVAVPNGQTIVLGGMITKEDDTIERKVPWLGDLPILKYAFRYDSTTTRRTELLIFLTPRIIRDDADSEIIKQIESERLHFIERDAELLHGPLFATPAGQSNIPKPVSTTRRGITPQPDSNFDDANVPTTDVPSDGVSQMGYRPYSAGNRSQNRSMFVETRKPAKKPARTEKKKSGWLKFPSLFRSKSGDQGERN